MIQRLDGVITAIGNREIRDRRLPLDVACWMRVQFKVTLGTPQKHIHGFVDLRLSPEAYGVVYKRFEETVQLPHLTVEYDEQDFVTFLDLPWWPGEEAETRTIEAMVYEANRT